MYRGGTIAPLENRWSRPAGTSQLRSDYDRRCETRAFTSTRDGGISRGTVDAQAGARARAAWADL